MNQNLSQGLTDGLQSGLNPSGAVAVQTIATFNFATYAANDYTSAFATDEWDLTDTYASGYPNNVGSEKLVNDTGTTGAAAIPRWNGTDYVSETGWKSGATAANTDTLVSDGTSAGDSVNQDLSGRIVFINGSSIAHSDVWLAKYSSSGWALWYNAGRFALLLNSGAAKYLFAPVTAGTIGNGAQHYVEFWYDQSADMMYMRGDLFDEVSAATTGVGSLSTGNALQINGWGGATSTNGHPDMTVFYAGVSVGANAESFYNDTKDIYGDDPTDKLSTTSLPADATVSISASDNAVATADAVAIAYDANLTGNFGLYCYEADSTDYRAAGNYVSEDKGEIQAVFVTTTLPTAGQSHYVFDTLATADRRALYINDSNQLRLLVNDSAGTLVADINLGTVAANTAYTAICQWDENAGLDSASVRGNLNGGSAVTGGSSFTSGGSFTAEICLGASGATANTRLEGLIASVTTYDGAQGI